MSNIKNREDIYIHSHDVNNGRLYVAYTMHQNRITQISGPTFAPAETTVEQNQKSAKKVKND